MRRQFGLRGQSACRDRPTLGTRPRPAPHAARIQVRPWRRWEEDAIARVYRQNLSGSYGLLERSRPYWHWLLERRAYDQFYVALDGPDLWDFKESSTRLVGYAAIKGEKIVELVTAPDRRKAAMELLARACGDAIEQDHRQISLHVPAGSPLLGYFRGEAESLPLDSREFIAKTGLSLPVFRGRTRVLK